MSYSVISIPKFEKSLKRLAKKYPSLKKEFVEFVQQIEKNPSQGIALGNNCYKIRISIASKGKGKSGGARIITHIKLVKQTVYLISIFDKNEQENIPEKEIIELLKYIP